MKIGQTSALHFLSRVISSAIGFAATVYIARLLGADSLGTYSLALTVVSWLNLAGNMGVSEAVRKRVSEGGDGGTYALTGVVLMGTAFAILACIIIIGGDEINGYIGFPAAEFVLLMLVVTLGFSLVTSLLDGRHLVHVSGILSPIKTGGRAVFQIIALFLGFGIVGLFGGYIIGYSIVLVAGSVVAFQNLTSTSLPQKHHIEDILSYAKYAWVGTLQSKTFNLVDVTVLGFFVSQSSIGYYAASWNIAQFLILFGGSLSKAVFPEISKLSAQGDSEQVSNLINSSLSYAGLILIPGLLGGVVIGERLLQIYGDDFSQASLVLVVLIAACLIRSYQLQITNTLNAIDRPDLSFRVNAVFILSNVALNIMFIWRFGVLGAATATALSAGISLFVSYFLLNSTVRFSVPIREISKQWVAAAIMSVAVYMTLQLESAFIGLESVFLEIIVFAGSGATIYFLILMSISKQFREVVTENLPFGVVQ